MRDRLAKQHLSRHARTPTVMQAPLLRVLMEGGLGGWEADDPQMQKRSSNLRIGDWDAQLKLYSTLLFELALAMLRDLGQWT